MDLRLFSAILAGKLITHALKIFGSGATAAPGLWALKIDPNLVSKLSKKIKNGSIIISGTNGKTTTARLTFDALSKKYILIHNRQGSNLLRGIASTLISSSNLNGNVNADLAIWEVDEATLRVACLQASAHIVVLLNLFRDQLDRYGEVDTVRKNWAEVVAALPKDCCLMLNSDDPGIASLKQIFKGKVVFFGLKNLRLEENSASISDVKSCPLCNGKLRYKQVYFAHIGEYVCQACGFKNPNANIWASDLKSLPHFKTKLKISFNPKSFEVTVNLPGTYNAYNILASAAVAKQAGILSSDFKESLASFTPAFGRFQKIKVQGKEVFTFLIKNPTGANEVIKVLSDLKNLNMLIILNDNFADGRDVSWIWDTNWEELSKNTKSVHISGNRSWDMADRLKYANFNVSKEGVYEQINSALQASIKSLDKNDTLYILPTYSALLEVQKKLRREGAIKWQKQ